MLLLILLLLFFLVNTKEHYHSDKRYSPVPEEMYNKTIHKEVYIPKKNYYRRKICNLRQEGNIVVGFPPNTYLPNGGYYVIENSKIGRIAEDEAREYRNMPDHPIDPVNEFICYSNH